MDDQEVANWVGGVAIGLMVAVGAWVLVSPASGTSGGDEQVRLSNGQPSSATSEPLRSQAGQTLRCAPARAATGFTGCLAAPAPSGADWPLMLLYPSETASPLGSPSPAASAPPSASPTSSATISPSAAPST
jgi:hypothetical protein